MAKPSWMDLLREAPGPVLEDTSLRLTEILALLSAIQVGEFLTTPMSEDRAGSRRLIVGRLLAILEREIGSLIEDIDLARTNLV